ncbi:MAG: ribonuclease III [Pseudomonadota bacterium]
MAQTTGVSEHVRQWAASALGHEFADEALLLHALTHPSRDGEPNYQRLEFLGDRVLGLVIAEWLYAAYPDEPEGRLANRYTRLVRKEMLAEIGRMIDLAPHIRMATAAQEADAAELDSVLSNVMEAVIAAVFLDGGLAPAQALIRRAWEESFQNPPEILKDAKSRLQEWAQARAMPPPQYEIVARTGPDHAPRFQISVTLISGQSAEAEGRSKRETEQSAAQALLNRVLNETAANELHSG